MKRSPHQCLCGARIVRWLFMHREIGHTLLYCHEFASSCLERQGVMR
jgi:hypothetical protein